MGKKRRRSVGSEDGAGGEPQATDGDGDGGDRGGTSKRIDRGDGAALATAAPPMPSFESGMGAWELSQVAEAVANRAEDAASLGASLDGLQAETDRANAIAALASAAVGLFAPLAASDKHPVAWEALAESGLCCETPAVAAAVAARFGKDYINWTAGSRATLESALGAAPSLLGDLVPFFCAQLASDELAERVAAQDDNDGGDVVAAAGAAGAVGAAGDDGAGSCAHGLALLTRLVMAQPAVVTPVNRLALSLLAGATGHHGAQLHAAVVEVTALGVGGDGEVSDAWLVAGRAVGSLLALGDPDGVVGRTLTVRMAELRKAMGNSSGDEGESGIVSAAGIAEDLMGGRLPAAMAFLLPS